MKFLMNIAAIILAILFISCGNDLPIEDDFGDEQFQLLDQNGNTNNFPQMVKGKIAVVGYIFTNCPDICPLTTNNMRMVQDRLKEEEINDGVEFVSVSFDPEVDRPEVLKKYAELRNLDLSNWTLFTGEKKVTDALIKEGGVFAMVGDSTIVNENEKIYYFVHTDRISLVDSEGNIRKNYLGSKLNLDEIVEDIKKLL